VNKIRTDRSRSPLHSVRTGTVKGRHVGLRLDLITSVLWTTVKLTVQEKSTHCIKLDICNYVP